MYNYDMERDKIFSEEGQRLFLGIRDNCKRMMSVSGAFTMGNAIKLPNGIGAADSWSMMACVDRLVELGEIREVTTAAPCAAQYRIFISGN